MFDMRSQIFNISALRTPLSHSRHKLINCYDERLQKIVFYCLQSVKIISFCQNLLFFPSPHNLTAMKVKVTSETEQQLSIFVLLLQHKPYTRQITTTFTSRYIIYNTPT